MRKPIDIGVVDRLLQQGQQVTTIAATLGVSTRSLERHLKKARAIDPDVGLMPDLKSTPHMIALPKAPTRQELIRAKWGAIYLSLHSEDGRERLQAAAVAQAGDITELVDDTIDLEQADRAAIVRDKVRALLAAKAQGL